ncbi:MAG: MMPL family transporter [Planctomycetaceae bacterium]
MTHFFDKRDRWGHGYALWVLAGMMFLVPFALWSLKQIRLENDVESWLPEDDPQAATLAWYRGVFPDEDRMLVSWDGSSLDDPRVARFAERLRGRADREGIRRNGLPEVESVVTPQDLIARMTQPNVGGQRVSHEEAVRRLRGVLVGPGKLKVRLTETGRQAPEARDLLLKQAREELGIDAVAHPPAPRPGLEEAFLEDEGEEEVVPAGEPTAEELAAEEAALAAEEELAAAPGGLPYREHDLQIDWPGMHSQPERLEAFQRMAAELTAKLTPRSPNESPLVAETFFVPGSPIAMTVVLSEAGAADRGTAMRKIHETAAEVGIPPETLRMGGSPVAGHELNVEVKKALSNTEHPWWMLHRRSPILLSCLVGALVSIVLLKNLRLATLVQASAFYTVLATVAVVPITGGSMNMVLVVMPTLLLVLTLSAAIHVANYWKNAANRDPATSVAETVRMAFMPCLLAAVTTAIGLMSLTTSPLAPVRDFGLYSSLGCLILLGVVLYALPAMLQYWPAAPPPLEEVDRTSWRKFAGLLCRHSKAVSIGCVALFVAGTIGLYRFRTEIKVIRYFPDESRVVQDYDFLEDQLAGIVPVQMIVRFDRESQTDLLFTERVEIVRDIQERMREHPEISGTLALSDFLPEIPPPAQASRLAAMRASRTALEVERGIQEAEGTAAFLTKSSEEARLPGSVGDENGRVLNEAGDELWRITAQVAIMSDLDYGELVGDEPHYAALPGNLNHIARSVLKDYGGADHVVTGTVPVFLRTQQAVLESLIRSFGLAFALIAVVMMVLLKNPLAGLWTMLPNSLPVAFVFGLVSWGRIPVDIGTMITASVALGIAVDGTLHLLTWFQAAIREGASRDEAVRRALAHCGPAMWQTSAAVGIGLLMLSFVDLLLVSRFGWLMAAMIGAALVADVVLLPTLLAGPLGRLLERTVAAEKGSKSPPTPASPAPAPHLEQRARSESGQRSSSGRILRID